MINEIGKTVLKLACGKRSLDCSGGISVNVSPVQLGSKSFINTVQSVLAETGLPANRLELEVTESSLFSDRNNPIAILKTPRTGRKNLH